MSKGTHPESDPPQQSPSEDEVKVRRHRKSEPLLPHERDESSSSQAGAPDERVAQAARDVKAGLEDTGRGPVVEKLKREHFPSTKSDNQPET